MILLFAVYGLGAWRELMTRAVAVFAGIVGLPFAQTLASRAVGSAASLLTPHFRRQCILTPYLPCFQVATQRFLVSGYPRLLIDTKRIPMFPQRHRTRVSSSVPSVL